VRGRSVADADRWLEARCEFPSHLGRGRGEGHATLTTGDLILALTLHRFAAGPSYPKWERGEWTTRTHRRLSARPISPRSGRVGVFSTPPRPRKAAAVIDAIARLRHDLADVIAALSAIADMNARYEAAGGRVATVIGAGSAARSSFVRGAT